MEYLVLVGVNYPPNNTRAEVGDILTDLPDGVAKAMLRAGAIERVPEVQSAELPTPKGDDA